MAVDWETMKAPLAQTPSLLKVSLDRDSRRRVQSFSTPFRIGRSNECELSINDEYVSRTHAEVVFGNGMWCIRDLNSANGLYLDGQRVNEIELKGPTTIRLGVAGPEILFEPASATRATAVQAERSGESATPTSKTAKDPVPPDRRDSASDTVLRRYVDHYFSKTGSGAAPASQHTVYLRRAFAKVQKQQKRTQHQIIAAVTLLAIAVTGYALYERRQLRQQRALAEDLFYTMKSLDLDIADLQRAVVASGNQQQVQLVRQDSDRRREMERSYDQFLASLHIYNGKMTEQQRLILRVARIFGECELDMPPGFEAEVNKYIKYWQNSDRLAKAVRIAQEKGYVKTISDELLDQGLPPQFFYLALQESDFNQYAVGPETGSGIAKGMWQFVPKTALKYGLHLGPLVDQPRPDPSDERNQVPKATKAAARYLKFLYATDAQASGILVMACYNWGENSVLPLVQSMPHNPRERNFWRLLTRYRERIPRQTYDYVFYIVSAAVIGENPRLFGFDFDNPLGALENAPSHARVPVPLPQLFVKVDLSD